MTIRGKLLLRSIVYGAALFYLIGDLFIFSGPLRKKLHPPKSDSPEAIAAARQQGICARVFNHLITLEQVDRAVADRLRREGKSIEGIPRKLLRYAALDELIDHELLRVKAMHNATRFTVSPEETEARLQAVIARFETPEAFAKSLPAQGFADLTAFRNHLTARIQQEKYVEARISPLAETSDEEISEWRNLHPDLTTADDTGIRAAIVSAKRHQATANFRAALRQYEHRRITVFHEIIGGP